MQGSILFNGNIVFEMDFINKYQQRICSSNHTDPDVQNSRKVLLICAAWGDDEHNDEFIVDGLCRIGIPFTTGDGRKRNIQNLSSFTDWQNFLKQHSEVSGLHQDCLATIGHVKGFYREKNELLIDLLKGHSLHLKKQLPGHMLADILGYNVASNTPVLHDLDPPGLLFHHYCREIQGTLAALIDSDNRQATICKEIHEYFFRRSRIESIPDYRRIRNTLIERILSSNSIFIFGGRIEDLYYSLRFWQLGEALRTAFAQGANFYTVSAGSMVLCEKIIIYDDFRQDRGQEKCEFEFFDHGFGLVTKVKLFPHCMERVKTDDPDNLTYLAYRFGGTACIGLNQESFFLLENYVREGKKYERFQSIGEHDGVYVFDPSGKKIRLDKNQELKLPGTWSWEY